MSRVAFCLTLFLFVCSSPKVIGQEFGKKLNLLFTKQADSINIVTIRYCYDKLAVGNYKPIEWSLITKHSDLVRDSIVSKLKLVKFGISLDSIVSLIEDRKLLLRGTKESDGVKAYKQPLSFGFIEFQSKLQELSRFSGDLVSKHILFEVKPKPPSQLDSIYDNILREVPVKYFQRIEQQSWFSENELYLTGLLDSTKIHLNLHLERTDSLEVNLTVGANSDSGIEGGTNGTGSGLQSNVDRKLIGKLVEFISNNYLSIFFICGAFITFILQNRNHNKRFIRLRERQEAVNDQLVKKIAKLEQEKKGLIDKQNEPQKEISSSEATENLISKEKVFEQILEKLQTDLKQEFSVDFNHEINRKTKIKEEEIGSLINRKIISDHDTHSLIESIHAEYYSLLKEELLTFKPKQEYLGKIDTYDFFSPLRQIEPTGEIISEDDIDHIIESHRLRLLEFLDQSGELVKITEFEDLFEAVVEQMIEDTKHLKADFSIYYLPFPTKEGFFRDDKKDPEYDEYDSVYQMTIDRKNPSEVGFKLILESKSILAAIQSFDRHLAPVCEIDSFIKGGKKISQDSKGGTLRKDGDKWRVHKKLKISIHN